MTVALWIDTDCALGAPSGDVDDGFAVAAALLAARRGQVRLLGISAVSGNTDGGHVHAALTTLVAAACADVPVVTEEAAPRALASLPAGTSLLAIGPPTSLVAAARLDPELPARIEVRLVGTVLRPLRAPLLPLFDLNFRRNPEATRAFRELGFARRLLFPLDVVRRLRFGRSELLRCAEAGPLGAHLAAHAERWLRRAPVRYLDVRFPVWDLVAGLHALDRLPGARLDAAGGALVDFDVEGARAAFFDLLSG